jgi:serine/threonine protein kinase
MVLTSCNSLGSKCNRTTVDHPNVLKLYGLVHGRPGDEINNWALVMEFVDPRTLLHNLLHGKKGRFGVDNKLRIALEVANAMAYLHARDIIHRGTLQLISSPAILSEFVLVEDLFLFSDLNPYSIYVTDDNTVKINAFSFPSALDMTHVWAVRYTAVCDGGLQSKQLDVFSFGILLWELFTEQTPFADISNPFQVATAIYEGKRPPLDDLPIPRSLCGAGLKELLGRCWDQSAHARPQFTEIAGFLTHLMSGT